jgi:exodeoxyribonuclease VII small subunit
MSEADLTFERALEELETIADALEQNDLDLDQALRLFERGIDRLRTAGRLLDSAHGRVEELVQGTSESLEIRPVDLGLEDTVEPGPG